MGTAFDPSSFTALGRLTGLVLAPDGRRLVAVRQEPDARSARYVSSLWGIDPSGAAAAVRLTHSEQGEREPAFAPDGALLFVSGRGEEDDEAALWRLPAWGEATVVARLPGGVSAPVVARDSGRVVLSGSRLADDRSGGPPGDPGAPGDPDEVDRAARKDRRERKLTHVLHDGFPIRHWDHELGDVRPRVFLLERDRPRDLFPDTSSELERASVSLSADGARLATTWHTRRRHGRPGYELAVLDLAGGGLRRLVPPDGYDYGSPVLSPDGTLLAAVRERPGDYGTPLQVTVVVIPLDSDGPVAELDTGELFPSELAWAGDSSRLVVAGDLRGRGALLVAEVASGTVRTLAEDAVYSSVCPAGDAVYALRSSIGRPPHPVRVDADGTVTELPAPDPAPELPGRLVEVEATAPDGERVRAWLALPAAASVDAPVPLELWVHGGPFGSWNAWSWRWCPWLTVARGHAVLLPDPALSTGYGDGWFARAWPHRAGAVWADLEAVLDEALRRPDLDAGRTALLGASFGGYLTNWIAGHTDRFRAIVTHAGLWALDQQHTTTDAAWWKTGLFGRPEDHPDWYAENSPDNFAAAIATPMLIVHGNRDYRVPVSEALRLWWDLVSRFDGDPDELPHRFLQFTGEHHWITTPGNARTWYETVLAFVGERV